MLYASEKLRLFIAALGASLIFVTAAVAPSEAHANGRHAFRAELVQPAADAKLVAGETLWRCEGQSCTAVSELTSSPRRFCAQLAKNAGALTSFRVDTVEFDVAQLERCNAAAD